MMIDDNSNKHWHEYFYYVLQELLTPVGLIVETELPVSTIPPKIDVIIIRRETEYWTPEQLERLPDGIRHSDAPYVLLEFKYTESFNEDTIYQIAHYDVSFRNTQKLSKQQVQCFLVISKTPQASRLAKYNYTVTEHKGVYKSSNVLSLRYPMLVLNKLGNEPYNVYFKLFASKLAAKSEAAKVLEKETILQSLPKALLWFLNALLTLWFSSGGKEMELEDILTPEQMVEAGKRLTYLMLPHLSLEERLAGTPVKEWLAGIPLEERLASIPLEERLASIPLDKMPEAELEKVPFVNHIEEKGIEKGEYKATLESLNQIITLRFKDKLGQFEEHLKQLPLETLKGLTETALTAETLADFKQTVLDKQAMLDKQADPDKSLND